MKRANIVALSLLISPVFALADTGKIYRCGGEYVNTVPDGEESRCKLVSGSDDDVESPDQQPDPAKWVRIQKTASGDVVYASKPPFQKEGNLIKRWSLWNYKNPHNDSQHNWFLSSMSLDLTNCTTRVAGSRTIIHYTEPSGRGKVVRSSTGAPSEIEFSDPVPGTIGELLIEKTCEKSITHK